MAKFITPYIPEEKKKTKYFWETPQGKPNYNPVNEQTVMAKREMPSFNPTMSDVNTIINQRGSYVPEVRTGEPAVLKYNPLYQFIAKPITKKLYGQDAVDTTSDMGRKFESGAISALGGLSQTFDTFKDLQATKGLPSLLYGDLAVEQANKIPSFTNAIMEEAQNVQRGVDLKGTEKVFGDIIQSLPLTAASVATGGAGLPIVGASAAGQKAYEAKEAGASAEKQALSGLVSGGIEVATEAIPLGALKKIIGIGGKDVIEEGLKAVVKTFAKEVGSEFVGEAISEAMDPVATQIYKDDAIKEAYVDNLEDTLVNIRDAGITGALSAVLFGGLSIGATSASRAISNTTPKTVNDTIVEMEEKGVDFTKEQKQQIIKETINYNKMTQPQLQQELQNIGMSPNGMTKAEMRNTLKTTQGMSPQAKKLALATRNALTPQGVQKFDAIQGDINRFNTQPNTINQEIQQNAYIEPQQADTVESLTMRAKDIINNLNDTNFDQSVLQLEQIQQKATSLGMNLQVFAEAKKDIQQLEEVQLTKPEEMMLKKHQKLIEELESKGITKSSQTEVKRLINSKKVIEQLKVKHSEELVKVKERYAKRAEARKESEVKTKLLKDVKKLVNRKDVSPELRESIRSAFGDIDLKAKNLSSKKFTELTQLKAELTALEQAGEYVQPELYEAISRLDKRRIGDLTAQEAQEMLDIVKSLDNKRKDANKARTIDAKKTRIEIINEMVNKLDFEDGTRKSRGIAKGIVDSTLGTESSQPKTVLYGLDKYSNGAFTKAFKALRDGANEAYRTKHKLIDKLNEALGDYISLAESPEWNKKQDINGVKLTSGQKVYLKSMLRDPQALRNVEQVGVTTKEQATPVSFTREQLENIKLNENEQKVYNVIDDILFETGKYLSDAHYELTGSIKDMKPKGEYIPIITDKVYRQQTLENFGLQKEIIANTGILKERVNAKSAMRLNDMIEVLDKHITIASNYKGLTKPIKDFNSTTLSPEVRLALQTKEGIKKNGMSPTEAYLEKLLLDIQGANSTVTRDDIGNALNYITKNFVTSTLAYRPSTMLKQVGSYFSALPELDIQSLKAGLVTKGVKGEAAQWNPRARERLEGRIDRDITVQDTIASSTLSRAQKKIIEKGLSGIQKFDEMTVNSLWRATKLYVAKQNPSLKGDALLKATSKKFDDVLDTQPNYTILEQSGLLRNKNPLAKTITMFGSARNAQLNTLKRSIVKARDTGDVDELKKAIIGFIVSTAFVTAIDAARRKLLNKETDLSKQFINNGLGVVPLVNEINTMLFRGYDVQVPSIDVINTTFDAISRMEKALESEDQDRVNKATKNLASQLSKIVGVPTDNVLENIELINNIITNEWKE